MSVDFFKFTDIEYGQDVVLNKNQIIGFMPRDSGGTVIWLTSPLGSSPDNIVRVKENFRLVLDILVANNIATQEQP